MADVSGTSGQHDSAMSVTDTAAVTISPKRSAPDGASLLASPLKKPRSPRSCLPGTATPVASGSDWTTEHLDFFGIRSVRISCDDFLGIPINKLPRRDFMKEKYPMLKHLFKFDTAAQAWPDQEAVTCLSFVKAAVDSAEAVTNNLILRLFMWLKYDHGLFRSVIDYDQLLVINNAEAKAQADLVILDCYNTVLVVNEHKSKKKDMPRPQLCAEIITSFQARQRKCLVGEKLASKEIPGIIVRGTKFDFFKMTVTADLADRVAKGIPFSGLPEERILLEQCDYIGGLEVGLDEWGKRELILGMLVEFKRIVFGWDGVLSPLQELFGQTEIRILLLGSAGTGKTTILNGLPAGDIVIKQLEPGFNLETTSYGRNLKFQSWNNDAQRSSRVDLGTYYAEADAILYCVDSSNRQRMEKSKTELADMLAKEELKSTTVVVLANKQDLRQASLPSPGAMSVAEIHKALGLDDPKNDKVQVFPVSALKGEGFDPVMKCLSEAIRTARNNKAPSPVPPTVDASTNTELA